MAQLNPVFIAGAVEGVTDEAILRRLVEFAGGAVSAVHVRNGKTNLRARVRGYNQAARFSPWMVLVDLDSDVYCAPMLRAQWLADPHPRMCFRIAVRAVEAWLLADREAIARFLAVPLARVPRGPEGVQHPKGAMVSLASQSRKRGIRMDMVPRPGSGRTVGPAFTSRVIEFATMGWRPDVGAQASDSLRRCIDCLRNLLHAIPG